MVILTTPTVPTSSAAVVLPDNPSMTTLAALEKTVLHVVLVAVDVFVVQLLFDFAAVIAFSQAC